MTEELAAHVGARNSSLLKRRRRESVEIAKHFSASTWQAYGGSAGDFGHASVSEQNRVFNNAMAQGGQSNWSPYDGC